MVVNIFGLRATDPAELSKVEDPLGPTRRFNHERPGWFQPGLLLIPLQLPPSPVLVFARRIEHALDVTVQCPHDTDARKHRWPTECRRMTKAIEASAACYDCNPILGGGDDVVTRSHENLRSTVRRTSRCKPGFGGYRCHHSIANAKATAVSLGRESLEHCWSRPLFCSRFWLRLFAIWNGRRTPIMPNL